MNGNSSSRKIVSQRTVLCVVDRSHLRGCRSSFGTAPLQLRFPRERVGGELNGRLAMTFRAYSGPRGSVAISSLDKHRLLYKEFDTLDGALAWAGHPNRSGRPPLLTEGDDGTSLGKREIAGAL